MKLISIPKDKYDDYRLDVIFDCYKWDPQFLDNNTIAKHVLVITEEEHKELEKLTEAIDKETIQAEEFLNNHLELIKPLALPRKLNNELKRMKNYSSEKHIRLMRYDFHPTIEGNWAVSEVNSDVPGGFAEASLMPKAAINLLGKEKFWHKNFGDILVEEISKKVKQKGRIMMVHCTSYSDDRQVMQFLGDKLKSKDFEVIYGAADHLHFEDKEAISILDGNEGKIDGIFRFTPLEWMIEMKPKHWDGYFDTITPSCNHPIAIFAQTKRFPLIWDCLEKAGINLNQNKIRTENIEEIIKNNPNLPKLLCIIGGQTQVLEKVTKRVNKIENLETSVICSYTYKTEKNIIESKYIDIMKKGCSKKAAIQILTDKLGIKQEEIIVMGDGGNDIPMFECAGIKVAMGNAEQYLKEKADFVTASNNENGVAKAIKKYIFNEE